MLGVVTNQGEALYDFMGEDQTYAATAYPACGERDPFLNSYSPPLPDPIRQAIEDDWTFVAHNARFEQDLWLWVCCYRWGWPMPRKWSCTAARARYWGLRGSLDGAASDLQLPIQKMAAGKEFINTFCTPRKYRGPKKNGIVHQMWAEPWELPEQYKQGKEYCIIDCQVEKLIDEMLDDLPFFEQKVWELDFKLNTHGIPIDVDGVQKAVHFSDHYTQNAVLRFNAITGVNPTQREKVLDYINAREETLDLQNLQSKTLSRLDNFNEEIQELINIRLDCSRASVKKLQAMIDNTSDDGYARGLFMYYGAHTGRWSAKRVQPQNFIRGNEKHAEIMFRYLDHESWHNGIGHTGLPAWVEEGDILFPRPLKTLASAMRGFIRAPDGQYILSGDYAQIEARVLAWLAGSTGLLNSFVKGEDTYVRFAAEHMYRRKYDEYFDDKGEVRDELKDERQRAKSAVLGCGFGLAAPGFQIYCDNQDIIMPLADAEFIVKAYRSANPEISDYTNGLWARVNWVAMEAVADEGKIVPLWGTEITYHVERLDAERWWLLCSLPSGRHIAYFRPKIDSLNRWGNPELTYRKDKGGFSRREGTYGGKLVENMVQAIARDICAIGAINTVKAGFDIFALIHDEIVALHGSNDNATKLHLKECLLDVPDWCDGLPLNADVKAMTRYSK
jgi:DNA polymerase